MLKEFKEFAIKGNAVDLAVGVIIGAAFGNIVNSLVKDVIMPPFGLVAGKVDFSNLYFNLGGGKFDSLAAAQAAGAPTINYGMFINTLINFVIVSGVIFLMVRWMNRMKRSPEAAADTKACPYCHSAIHLSATRCPACTSQLN